MVIWCSSFPFLSLHVFKTLSAKYTLTLSKERNLKRKYNVQRTEKSLWDVDCFYLLMFNVLGGAALFCALMKREKPKERRKLNQNKVLCAIEKKHSHLNGDKQA